MANRKLKKIKVISSISTRPDIIKMSEIIKELDRETDHILVHTGQNYDYELNEVFFKDLGVRKPDYFLGAASAGKGVVSNALTTIGNILVKFDEVLGKVKPDAFMVLGDVNGALASVYAAKRRKIPVFHMEAGNRSCDERVPEEINRRMIDHIADINMVYSDLARQNLINEGLPLRRLIKVGSPMFEVLNKNEKKIRASKILAKLSLKPGDYFTLSIHRDDNISNDKNFPKIIKIINSLTETHKKRIIFGVHPRTQKRIDELKIKFPKNVEMMKPLGFLDYVKLQMNAFCVLTDSGTVSEESSILNFPAVNLREAHERNEAMDEGSVIMTGLNPERVLQAVEIASQQSRGTKREFNLPDGYGNSNVSKKVARIILSYTDYINRTTWFKDEN